LPAGFLCFLNEIVSLEAPVLFQHYFILEHRQGLKDHFHIEN